MFAWVRRKLVKVGVRWHINRKFKRYGRMTELKIDNERRTIEATVMLKGETSPIQIRCAHYELKMNGEAVSLTIGDVSVSREWMSLVAAEFLKNRSISLPAGVAKW